MHESNAGWQESLLGELADIAIGGTPSRDVDSYWASDSTDGFPWVAISDLHGRIISDTKEKISAAGVKNSNVKPVSAGTMLMSFKLSLGRVAFAGCDLFTNEAIAALKPRGEIAENFLFYVLPEIVRTTATDTAIKGATLNKESLRALRIPYPCKAVQQRIATILTSIDTAIEKTEALIAKYQQIKTGLMHDLFTRGVLPNDQLRPPREEAPELYQETAVGWIPREWSLQPFGMRVEIIDPNPSHRYPSEVLDGVPICSTENFDGEDDFTFENAKFVPHKSFSEQNNRCQFKLSDVVFARKGRIGLARRYGQVRKVFSHTVVIFKPRDQLVNPEWLLWAVRSSWFLGGIDRTMNSNSGVPTLGVDFISKVSIPFPGLDEQLISFKILDCASASSCRLRSDLNKLKAQKLGLMNDLLTGRVPVKVKEPELVDG